MKKLTYIFVVAILCVILFPSAAVALETPSAWAQAQVSLATSLDLVPVTLRSEYTQPTTRAEFCALAVALYEKTTGKEIAERKTFADTTDINIQKMGGLGIVSGVGENMFAPEDTLTREQAAVMLANFAKVIGKPLGATAADFADNAQISSWASAQVGQVQAAGIMSGVSNNNFAPKDLYTREQSIVTIVRLYDFLTVPVERISIGINPKKSVYEVGEEIELNIKFYPDNATDKNYYVTIERDGKIIENLPQNQSGLELTEDGKLTVRAVASNGVENTQDFTVIDLDAFTDKTRQEFYVLINNHRGANGLRELDENIALQEYADIRAAEQLTITGHTRPDGTDAGSGWYDSQNFMNTRYAENAYWSSGYTFDFDPKEAALHMFTQWKESTGHNRHMLYDFDSNITMALGLHFYLEDGRFETGAIWASGY